MARRTTLLLALLAAACSAGAEPDDTSALRAHGRALFFGRAGCASCHSLGDEGGKTVGPNLGVGGGMQAAVAARAPLRRPGLKPIEYITESILDPDALIAPGYSGGVMRRYDEAPISLCDDEIIAIAAFLGGEGVPHPPTIDDLKAARAEIPVARRQRAVRRAQSQANDLLARIRWEAADPTRGPEVFSRLGCAVCHDNPETRDLRAPTLAGIGARLEPLDIARWVVLPAQGRMPSYRDAVAADELGCLSEYLARTGPLRGAQGGSP